MYFYMFAEFFLEFLCNSSLSERELKRETLFIFIFPLFVRQMDMHQRAVLVLELNYNLEDV